MRFTYSVILYCLIPLIILRLYWLSLRNPGYRKRIAERFGRIAARDDDSPLLWIHAVSVGEVQATTPLVNAVNRDYPQFRILITTTTPTGADTVLRLYRHKVSHRYIPYDLPGAVERFCNRIRPDLLIVMETEIWPNLYHTCYENGVPVIIANARLSARSLAGYKKLASLARHTLSMVTRVITQSHADAERFASLGVADNNIRVSGNLKFDVLVPEETDEHTEELKTILGPPGRRIWLAASTHEREEQIVLESHAKILDEFPDCLLIIAPRHPERFAEVARLARDAGFTVLKKTDGQFASSNIQVFILDTLGDLPACYAMTDVAFIGGSLVPAGGHNPLEAAALAVPVLFGPHIHNIDSICTELLACGAAKTIVDATGLADAVLDLFNDRDKCLSAGESARAFVESNRGSVDSVMDELQPLLEKSDSNRFQSRVGPGK